MGLKYYVLWQKDSPLLKEYLDKYYYLLVDKLTKIKDLWILESHISSLLNIENRDFILSPDQSSIINYIYKEKVKNNPEYLWDYLKYENILALEIDKFLSWKEKTLIMNTWLKISWTNIRLTPKDHNPYNIQEAHPEHKETGWVLWYWNKKEYEWLDVYEKTFSLLKKVDLWIYGELNQIIKKIVPLWTSVNLHNSASYKECIWHLYMWYTINSWRPEINNLEAIIHESSHNKINLIMHFDKVLLNWSEQIYYSSIRPDARPIHWVFLWYHAFAPTIYILMKSYSEWLLWDDNNLYEKILLYYIKTKFLQKIIKKYAKFTKLWEEISLEIDYVIDLMIPLLKSLKPGKDILERVRERQNEHFKLVNQNYPYLRY